MIPHTEYPHVLSKNHHPLKLMQARKLHSKFEIDSCKIFEISQRWMSMDSRQTDRQLIGCVDQHTSGYVRHPFKGHGVGCLWLLVQKPNTGGD